MNSNNYSKKNRGTGSKKDKKKGISKYNLSTNKSKSLSKKTIDNKENNKTKSNIFIFF